MGKQIKRLSKRMIAVLLIAFGAALLGFPAHRAYADGKLIYNFYWGDVSGDWSEPANWSNPQGLVGPPGAGDIAWLTSSNSMSRTVNYQYSPDFSLDSLTIGNGGGGDFLLNQKDGILSVVNAYIGVDGRGTFTLQNGVHNTVAGETIGQNGTGAYYQYDGTHNVGGIAIGINHGTGTYDLYGGIHKAVAMTIGGGPSGAGTYSMYQGHIGPDIPDTLVDVSDSVNVGYYGGRGIFNQNGGTHQVGYLLVGAVDSGTGTYNLNWGSLIAANEVIGSTGGTGEFVHVLGVNQVENLIVGYNGDPNSFVPPQGTYTLALEPYVLSELRVTAQETIGLYNSQGTFIQNGGTHSVHNDLSTAALTLGKGGTGTYNFNAGTLNADQLILGENGGSGTFNHTQTGYSPSFSYVGTLIVGHGFGGFGTGASIGDYYLNGSLSIYSQLSAEIEMIGAGWAGTGTGTFTQDGGFNVIYKPTAGGGGVLTIGAGAGGTGTYFLNNGALNVDGNESIGYHGGTGTLIQKGGTHEISNNLFIGSLDGTGFYDLQGGKAWIGNSLQIDAGGSLTQSNSSTLRVRSVAFAGAGISIDGAGKVLLDGGQLNSTDVFVGYAAVGPSNPVGGTFDHKGGTHTVANTLTLAANPGSHGTYNLLGTGTLKAGGVQVNAGGVFNLGGGTLSTGSVINRGTFNYTGGALNAGMENYATATLTGAGTRVVEGPVANQSTGSFNVTDTNAVFNGFVTNSGIFKVTNSTYEFRGGALLTNALITDPSVGHFYGGLAVGANGYIQAAAGDLFYMYGNFTNNSTETGKWDTAGAALIFAGGGVHHVNPGNNAAFTWGTVQIGSTNGALDEIYLDGGTLFAKIVAGLILTGGTISNVHGGSGVNFYYDPLLNPNLSGIYGLDGGGFLAPIGTQNTVPIPGAIWLLGPALGGIMVLRRRWAL
jgi:hypothetical protein